MLSLRIEKETYLNLFLTAVAVRFSQSPDFPHYLHLLLHFKAVTGKKSADANYVGYKDRIPVLMHACAHASPENLRIFLSTPGLNLTATGPSGRSALFYAVSHPHEGSSCAIASLLLDAEPSLVSYWLVRWTPATRWGVVPSWRLQKEGSTVWWRCCCGGELMGTPSGRILRRRSRIVSLGITRRIRSKPCDCYCC
jgi:hypothetical protein